MNDPTGNASLIARYDTVPYQAQANPLSHPGLMAAVAVLHGLQPAPVEDCRVLELGCSEGANLLPMAATLPRAAFTGCDLSPRAVESARGTASELGLTNTSWLDGDLRELPHSLGEFDYIIAHGVYSWVPAPVRDALFEIASRRLSQNGVMFVSYNTYPGCHVRRAAWEIMHLHTRDIASGGSGDGCPLNLRRPRRARHDSIRKRRRASRRIPAPLAPIGQRPLPRRPGATQ